MQRVIEQVADGDTGPDPSLIKVIDFQSPELKRSRPATTPRPIPTFSDRWGGDPRHLDPIVEAKNAQHLLSFADGKWEGNQL